MVRGSIKQLGLVLLVVLLTSRHLDGMEFGLVFVIWYNGSMDLNEIPIYSLDLFASTPGCGLSIASWYLIGDMDSATGYSPERFAVRGTRDPLDWCEWHLGPW